MYLFHSQSVAYFIFEKYILTTAKNKFNPLFALKAVVKGILQSIFSSLIKI
jgi:hypothetical protein